MSRCEVCGNDYDKAFTVTMSGQEHTFDSFECAITALAPVCAHCGCKVVGHGVEESGEIFCCEHCARHADHGHATEHAHEEHGHMHDDDRIEVPPVSVPPIVA